jgi:hypothetical protein
MLSHTYYVHENQKIKNVPRLLFTRGFFLCVPFLGSQSGMVSQMSGVYHSSSAPLCLTFNMKVIIMVLGSTQPLAEMSTRNLPGDKGRAAHKANRLTAICEPTV